jgi:outer membrane murein-binding lipoprotein Lpp
MRATACAVVIAAFTLGCGKKSAPAGEAAQIVDLTASIDELKRDFDAHKDVPRFVTLIAPS